MTNQMTSRDYELISAYLDNQLGNQERERFEARLKIDPILQKGLKELSQTRSLLRALPKIRAPRNYYINAQDVSMTENSRPLMKWAPAMGIVSALATILLVLVIFGDTFLTSTTPVALAPAAPVALASAAPVESVSDQQEVQRIEASTSSPTETQPSIMMQAPAIESPILPQDTMTAEGEQIPTPTTIYLFAFLPTATPEITSTILGEQAKIAEITCEEYLASGAYPTLPYIPDCPTPTPLQSFSLQGIPPTSTVTITLTITYTLELNTTPSSTETLNPTITPSPKFTQEFSATPYPSVIPSDTAAPLMNAAPSIEQSAPSAKQLPGQEMDTGVASPTEAEVAEEQSSAPNTSFIRYLILAAEISLAAIAIIAGIIAIILRVRTGR
jgi:hypothetical protein